MSTSNVLVFGPTGGVGAATAAEARKRGSHVWLAMRDPSKTITGLSKDGTDPSGYSRVQADLTKPDSIKAAVKESQATAAFIYRMETEDNMRGAISALKEVGVTYVVFLSSFSVQGSPNDADKEDHIAQEHAQIEIALDEIGLPYSALRPAYFNSNVNMFYGEGLKKGEVDVFRPGLIVDFISPQDIGAVAGTLLAGASPVTPPKYLYLCGPQKMTLRDGFGVISSQINREIIVNELSEQDFRQRMSFLPEPIVESLIRGFSNEDGAIFGHGTYDEGASNVKKYTGREPTQLADWARENLS